MKDLFYIFQVVVLDTWHSTAWTLTVRKIVASSSLTAQDMLELHLHGSTAIMKAVLSSLSAIPGFRPAEPGEFTRLAFDSGRMDLTEVEGLRDLIESETEAQRNLALQQAGVSNEQECYASSLRFHQGQMRKAYESMRADIISAMSVMEALIDFGEDENIDESTYQSAQKTILRLHEVILQQLERAQRAEVIRSGIRLAIFGAPNAGKSSLTNWLGEYLRCTLLDRNA